MVDSNKTLNYTLRFKLTSFIGSRVIEVENQDGDLEKGVFIPIDINGICQSPKTGHYFCDGFVNESFYTTEESYSHYIVQRRTAKDIEGLERLGYKPPQLGYLYPKRNGLWFKTPKPQSGRVKLTELQYDGEH